MQEKERHLVEYLVLFTGFAVLLVLFYLFKYNRNALIMISGGGSVFYSIWGIIHHGIEGRLNKEIALEYMMISVLVFILLYIALTY